MLAELYQYAVSEGLAVRPGFKEKNVKFYIDFGADGSFLGFDPIEKGANILCPDIGTIAQGKKSNIVAEKLYIILNCSYKNGIEKKSSPLKSEFYINTMKQAAEHDELFAKAIEALEQNREKIIDAVPDTKGLKYDDIVSIRYDGKPLEKSEGWLDWWTEFRQTLKSSKPSQDMKIDFITGELCEPLDTVGKVSGLSSVGGRNTGDSLICFDKTAFQSYNLKQAANATVGDETMTAVNLALNDLLKKSEPLANAQDVHWYKESTDDDLIDLLDIDIETGFDGLVIVSTDEDNDEAEEEKEKIREDEKRIKTLFESFSKGLEPTNIKNRYYTMSLSGNSGRVIVRSYDEGSYEELYNNLKFWYDDLKIIRSGHGCKYPKLWAIYGRMLKYSSENKNPKKMSENIGKELAGISPQIRYAILHGTQLPDFAAARMLQYIRSDLYSASSDDQKKKINIDRIACQFLKAWLNRKYRNNNEEEKMVMETLNENSPSVAYHVGRLMALYAQIQREALGKNIGAGVIEKYYTSCCTAPALVIGKLATLSQYHLSKLDNGAKVRYSKQLQEVSCKIGTSIPKTFSLEEQSQFALGFYFQNSEMFKPRENNNENSETEE